MSAIQQALCSINNFLVEFTDKFRMELKGVDSSLKKVSYQPYSIPQKLASRNPNRVELLIHNASSKKLSVAFFKGEVNRELYSLSIAPDDTLFLNSHNFAHLYKGEVYGFWEENAPSTSKAMLTEFYIK